MQLSRARRLSSERMMAHGACFESVALNITSRARDWISFAVGISSSSLPDVATPSFRVVSHSWEPGGPNASSLATLSYYQTFLNRQVELKVGYLANAVEYWGPFLAGNLSSGIFGPSGSIPVEAGLSAWAWTKPGINIKLNGPNGLYNKFGVQVASNPDGPLAEKTANPTGLNWSTPNSGILVINEFGYRKEATPGQLATWVRAAPIVNTSRYIDFEFGGRGTGNYAAYVLADQQFVQLAPVAGQAARGVYAGVTAMYAPPEFDRFSQYYELRLYGIGLLPSRPRDMIASFTPSCSSIRNCTRPKPIWTAR